MIPIYELHPGSFIKSPTGTGIAVWTAGNYEGIEKEFTDAGWIYKVEPEPLTIDILQKIGFEKIENKSGTWARFVNTRWYLTLVEFAFGYKIESLWYSADIQYLHQLQNLWIVLCGEELKYNP